MKTENLLFLTTYVAGMAMGVALIMILRAFA